MTHSRGQGKRLRCLTSRSGGIPSSRPSPRSTSAFWVAPLGAKILEVQIPDSLQAGPVKSAAIAAVVLDIEVERRGGLEPIVHARRILLSKIGITDCALERQANLRLLAA
jgi:hypothetical protein